jgi:hypothetical protein
VQGLLQQIGLPLPVDYAVPGATAGPAGLAGETTRVNLVDDDTEGWLAHPGTWGRPSTSTRGRSRSGRRPSPAFHAIWADPLGTQARWPVG